MFASDPIPFAVREPDVDLDAVERPGVALWMQSEDADGLCAALKEPGIEIAQPPFDGPFGRTFAFVDPDGYIVTLHE